MKSLSIKVIIEKIDGKLLQGTDTLIVTDIITRSKNIRQGFLLFDIYHDKEMHMLSSADCPPCAVVTDKPLQNGMFSDNITVVQVDDINNAYWKFVEFYRALFNIPVIGVTGTCGKTTTKEMIVHILSEDYKVNATHKSLNADFRHLGYLLDINDDSQVGVFEMGVASPGDIKKCCRYFKPQIGVITNIGVDHLQKFDSLDSYIKAKGEFIEGLDYKGTLIINADDKNIKKIDFSKYKGNLIKFGYDRKSDFIISNIQHINYNLQFTIQYKDEILDISIPGCAEFNAYNAAAAIVATHTLGVNLKKAGDRLKSFKNVEKHFEYKKGINDSIIIDDTWSTNPTSTETALKLLKKLSLGKKTIAVLGKMSLLGSQGSKYHIKMGEIAASLKIDKLIILGEEARKIGLGALQKGMDKDNVYFCKDSKETYKILKNILDNNSIVLIKTTMLESYDDLINNIITKNYRFN